MKLYDFLVKRVQPFLMLALRSLLKQKGLTFWGKVPSFGWTLLTVIRVWVRWIVIIILLIISLCLTGTASAVMWTLRAEGRLFHSGLPHKGINSMELAMEAMAYIQKKFYLDFPPVSIGWIHHDCIFVVITCLDSKASLLLPKLPILHLPSLSPGACVRVTVVILSVCLLQH